MVTRDHQTWTIERTRTTRAVAHHRARGDVDARRWNVGDR
jgi:hypothetical protein